MYRFLFHSLSHTWLVVDISRIGLPTEVYPEDGKEQMVPSLRFQRWSDVEHYLTGLGADPESLQKLSVALKQQSVGILTIVERWQKSVTK
jgi:hypothetical protein